MQWILWQAVTHNKVNSWIALCQDQSGWSVVDRCIEIGERFLVLFYLHSIYNDVFNGKYRHSSIDDARAHTHTPSLDRSSRHQFSNVSLCVSSSACLPISIVLARCVYRADGSQANRSPQRQVDVTLTEWKNPWRRADRPWQWIPDCQMTGLQ